MKALKLPDGKIIRMDDPPDYILKIIKKIGSKGKHKTGVSIDDEDALDMVLLKQWMDEQDTKYGNG